jgi:hypothetical protein
MSARDDYPQFDLFTRNSGLNAPPTVVDDMRRALEEIDKLRTALVGKNLYISELEYELDQMVRLQRIPLPDHPGDIGSD